MSVRSLGQLTIDMLLKTGSLEQGMDRAARAVDRRSKEIASKLQAVGTVAGTALATGAAAAVTATKLAIDQMDELSKAAQRVTMPTEQFSALAYAGSLADVSIQDLQSSLGKLTKAQADSLSGTSEQAKIFKALGISVSDSTGKLRDNYDVLLDFADAYKRHAGSEELLAAGIKVFGRNFQTLIPLLKDGADGIRDATEEARLFGLEVSTGAGRNAEQFNDDLSRLQSSVYGFWTEVADGALPHLVSLSSYFVQASKEGDDFGLSARDIGDAVGFLAEKIKEADAVGASFRLTLQGMVQQAAASKDIVTGILSGDLDQVRYGAGQYREGQVKAVGAALFGVPQKRPKAEFIDPADLLAEDQRRAEEMKRARAEADRLRRLAFGDEDKKTSSEASKRAKEADREAKQRADALEKSAAQAKLAAAALSGPYAEAVERADQQAKAWRKEVEAGNMTLDSEKKLLAASAAELEARRVELEKQQKAPQALLDTMTGELRLLGMIGPARERYQRQLQNENEMRRAIAEAIEGGNTALRNSPDMQAKLIAEARAFADWSMQVEEAAARAEEWAGIVVGGVADASSAFADFVANGADEFGDFWDDLKDIAKRGVADLIRQFLNQKIVIPIQTQILNGMNGQSSGSGFWSSLMGMFNGGGGQGGGGFWSSLAGLFKGNGFAGAGQNAGNWASMIGGNSGGGGFLSAIGSLFGGGTSAATSVASTGGTWGGLAGMANASQGIGGASGAAAGGASGMASAVPIIGWIIAGMMKNAELFDQGWDIANGESWAGKAATLGAVGHADKVFRSLGFSDKISSILSGSSIHAKLFGRKKPEITAQGITGTYGFGGFDGQAYADIKQKGGLFRSTKRWTEYGTLDTDVDKALDKALKSVKTGAEQLAKQLGIDISKQLSAVRVNIGKLQLDADPEKAQQQIEALISKMIGELSTQSVRILGFGNLLNKGFEAGDVMSALAASISLVTGSAEGLGRALEKWELGNITKGVEFFMKLAQENGTTLEEEVARVTGVLSNYGALMADVQGQLLTAGLNDYQRAALGIETTYREQVRAANEYARALGLSGARAEDLAKIEELRAHNMAALQQQFEKERNSILGDLALSEYSPLNDTEKLDEAMKQLQDAVSAGDLSGASALRQTVLGLGRNLYASGRDYEGLYDRVSGLIGGMGLPELDMDDGTTMGDLAGILIELPQNIARQLFALASGAEVPLPAGGTAGRPTGGNGQPQSAGGSNGGGSNDTDLLTQIRDTLRDIASNGDRDGVVRTMERLTAMNR